MESMREYVIRRVREVKNYRETAEKADLGEEWLRKIAQDAIANPGLERMEKAYRYFRSLEGNGKRKSRKRVVSCRT
jgi:hypothetical protein